MAALLAVVQDGETIENALQAVYGFDTDGLESAWRQSLGYAALPTRPARAAQTSTPVPTLAPLTLDVAATATAAPTATAPLLPTATGTQPPTTTAESVAAGSPTPAGPAATAAPPAGPAAAGRPLAALLLVAVVLVTAGVVILRR